MSLKVIKCEATWSEFKRNVALTKSRNMSAIYGSSILLQHDPPRCSNPSSRRRKRSPSSKRRKRSPSIYNEEGANGEPASKPRSFTKELRSKCTIHTAQCCRLVRIETASIHVFVITCVRRRHLTFSGHFGSWLSNVRSRELLRRSW